MASFEGKIIKGIAGFYYVFSEEIGIAECRAKGLFRNKKLKPLPGDLVKISLTDEALSGCRQGKESRFKMEEGAVYPQGSIDEVFPRKNELIRPPVANIDQVLIVFAVKDPEPHLNLLDRFLLTMEKKKIPVIILFNKTDLTEEKDTLLLCQIYKKANYSVFGIQANSPESKETVNSLLTAKTTVLAGPSGVGKSTLMNLIHPDAGAVTGELSEKIKRGKNTTRHTELIHIGRDSYLIDTPGFSSLYIDDIPAEEISSLYPEIAAHEDGRRFAGCSHIKEPDCAVKKALELGLISRERYDNYTKLYQEALTRKKY